MRTVFLGTSEFAAAVLDELADSPHRPLLAITRPDRPAGRGRKLHAPPVAARARELGIELDQPEKVNEAESVQRIAALEPEAVLVCAFGALIKEPLLSTYEMLNVHPSLLPRWRGAAPIERAMIAGDECTGVSIMRLTAGLDSGPVCLAAQEPIGADDDYGTLAARLQRIGARLLIQALDTLQRGESLDFSEQDESHATYAEKIVAADRTLDPTRPAADLERLVRALHPHIGARVALPDGTQLGVLQARVAAGDSPGDGQGVPDGQGALDGQGTLDGQGAPESKSPSAGTLRANHGRLRLACAEGELELLSVQPPGGRPMDAASYLRGRGLPAE